MYPQMSIEDFLAKLASSAAEPGGGAAAALAGAVGAALVSMVANLTIGKEKFASVQGEMEKAQSRAQAMVGELATAVDRDAESFRRVMDAYKMPRETDEQKAARKKGIQQALRAAATPPLDVIRLCREIADWSKVTADKGNPQVITDAAIAGIMADAAAQSAALNVKINLGPIGDPAFSDPLWAGIQKDLDYVRAARDEILKLTYDRLG